MSKEAIVIREIKAKDDVEIAKVIRAVLVEMGVPKIGTAYADAALDRMTATYDRDKSAYFIVEDDGIIIGGAGIAPLENFAGNICELQKMYFLPKARGKGLGTKMMDTCMKKAKSLGFEKCYLETLPYMKAATKLYNKSGFENLDAPMGDTGHYSCNVWMIKSL